MQKFLITISTVLACLLSKAQTDDLMIVEYVDWQSGSGWAVKIHNPTNQIIDLSDYRIVRYRDGESAISASADISGSISPGEHKIVGNSTYCSDCPNGCNAVTGIVGTNSEDAVAIAFGPNNENIDMVGAWGVQTEITVNGISDAVYQHTLKRKTDNCIRYFDMAGTSVNAWPDNVNENVTTWEIMSPVCLTTASFSFQLPSFEMASDTTICEGEELVLDYSALDFESYVWVGQDNQTALITITDSGAYTLQVSENFCATSRTIDVHTQYCDSIPPPDPEPVDSVVYVIPNIITPNKDEINDAFVLEGFTEQVSVEVFNRWGKKVYENTDYKNDWEGGNLSDGVYFYHIKEGFVALSGWLQISR